MEPPLIFVVIEDDPVIAEDIAETVKDYAANAIVEVWSAFQATSDAVRALQGICAAFVAMNARDMAVKGLDNAFEALGGVVVMTDVDGSPTADDGSGRIGLERPFTSDQIHSVLHRLGVARTDRVQ